MAEADRVITSCIFGAEKFPSAVHVMAEDLCRVSAYRNISERRPMGLRNSLESKDSQQVPKNNRSLLAKYLRDYFCAKLLSCYAARDSSGETARIDNLIR
jgi:hypothetical protein